MLKHTDIIELASFEAMRKEKLKNILALKKRLKLSVGPDITFHFENTETIWWQIQEMLRIEKGGHDQIQDELNAYNPLIPQKTENSYEVSATLMIEIDDPVRRNFVLKQLYEIDQNITLEWAAYRTKAFSIEPTEERNRDSDQKTSSVHFLKWLIPFNEVSNFLDQQCILKINHPHYFYEAQLPSSLKKNLQEDFNNRH
jgi:hypothetical protein